MHREPNEAEEYTKTYHTKCLTDASDVVHTVTYKKATCTRVDDIILNFHFFFCSNPS